MTLYYLFLCLSDPDYKIRTSYLSDRQLKRFSYNYSSIYYMHRKIIRNVSSGTNIYILTKRNMWQVWREQYKQHCHWIWQLLRYYHSRNIINFHFHGFLDFFKWKFKIVIFWYNLLLYQSKCLPSSPSSNFTKLPDFIWQVLSSVINIFPIPFHSPFTIFATEICYSCLPKKKKELFTHTKEKENEWRKEKLA